MSSGDPTSNRLRMSCTFCQLVGGQAALTPSLAGVFFVDEPFFLEKMGGGTQRSKRI